MERWKTQGCVPDSDEEDEDAVVLGATTLHVSSEVGVRSEDGVGKLDWKLSSGLGRAIGNTGDAPVEQSSQQNTRSARITTWSKSTPRPSRIPITSGGSCSRTALSTQSFKLRRLSDDEDELSLPSSPPGAALHRRFRPPTETKTALSTAGLTASDTNKVIQDETDVPLPSEAASSDVFFSHNPEMGVGGDVTLSSPLSSPLASIADSLDISNYLSSHSAQPTVQVRIPSRAVELQGLQVVKAVQVPERPCPARTLRQRKAIQLHPYEVEQMKYKAQMHDQGYRPVRIAEKQPSSDDLGVESQERYSDQEDSQEQHQLLSSPTRSLPSEIGSQPLDDDVANGTVGADDELPDVDTLLVMSPQMLREGPKRRKISHSYSKKGTSAPQTVTRFICPPAPRAIQSFSPPRSSSNPPDALCDLPPSPYPPAADYPSSIKTFHPKPTVEVTQLQTPAASSSAKKIRPTQPIEFSFPMDESAHDDCAIIVSEASDEDNPDDSLVSSQASETEPEIEVTHMQKRIKGVLPASWSTLNFNAQGIASSLNKAATSRRNPTSPAKRQQRGVAHFLAGKRPSSRDNETSHDTFVVSDESEDDTGEVLRPDSSSRVAIVKPILEQVYIWSDDDAMEVDTIDAMLPPRISNRKAGSSNRGLMRHRPGQDQQQSKMSDHIVSSPKSRHAKPRRKLTKLGILDAQPLADQATPNFLRVAARTARSRRDQGRHSARQKAFHLDDESDDADTPETTRSWRKGTLHYPSQNATRITLKNISGNERRRNEGTEEGRAMQKAKTQRDPARASARPRPRRPRPRTLPESFFQCSYTKPPPPSAPTQKPRVQRVQMEQKAGTLSSHVQTQLRLPAQLEESLPGCASAPSIRRRKTSYLTEGLMHSASDFTENEQYDRAPERMIVSAGTPLLSKLGVGKPLQRRKRPPRRRDRIQKRPTIVAVEVVNDNGKILPSEIADAQEQLEIDKLRFGRLTYGATWSVSFGVNPITSGACMHNLPFVGSGLFANCLDMISLKSKVPSKDSANLRPPVWGDTARTLLGHSLQQIYDALNVDLGRTIAGFEEMIEFIGTKLVFLDSEDRISFLQHCMTLSAALAEHLTESRIGGAAPQTSSSRHALAAPWARLTLIDHQLLQVAKESSVSWQLKDSFLTSLKLHVRKALEVICSGDLEDLAWFCQVRDEASQHPESNYELAAIAESFVIVRHVILRNQELLPNLWLQLGFAQVLSASPGVKDGIGHFEREWRRLFAILPLLDIDKNGNIPKNARELDNSNWLYVKKLITPTLEQYNPGRNVQAGVYNQYFRVLCCRCLDLIRRWGWQQCSGTIGMLFDSFARRKLAHLPLEESHGSPDFLENLKDDISLASHDTEPCFHILLKIIGAGIRQMYEFLPYSKISGFLVRMLPNHDRHYAKDKGLRQEDLDALRNHHDLLCTLYWAFEPSQRPSLKLVRQLVQEEGAHMEVYRLNIRAWSKLVRYQLGKDCQRKFIEPFAIWWDDLLEMSLRQHALARAEVEIQVNEHITINGCVPRVNAELIISSNQKEIEAVICDLLQSQHRAISECPTPEAASTLLTPGTGRVLRMFDNKLPRLNHLIVRALENIRIFVGKSSVVETDEDSQGLDWGPALSAIQRVVPTLTDVVTLSLRDLLTTCFDSFSSPADSLLVKLVNTWVLAANYNIDAGARTWDEYISKYGNASWSLLPDTEQTRRYTPYFYAQVLRKTPIQDRENKSLLLKAWIASLVERESQLRYQAELTSELLNMDGDDPLFRNLPFSSDTASGKFAISAQVFQERRLSLLTSLFSNMRSSLSSQSPSLSPIERGERRSEYVELLKHLMATMKARFLELGDVANSQSTHVHFLHVIIEALQVHTQDICPVDPFFSSSAAFPLPISDPSFVVSKLKAYGLRLHEPNRPKQLCTFLQTIVERAVAEGQQGNLTKQISAATANTPEDLSTPTLRTFLVSTILPAYLKSASNHHCGWLLAIPVIDACRGALRSILDDFDSCEMNSLRTLVEVMHGVLGLCHGYIKSAITAVAAATAAQLRVLTAIFSMVTTILPTLDYFIALGHEPENEITTVEEVVAMSLYITERVHGNVEAGKPQEQPQEQSQEQPQIPHTPTFGWTEVTAFTTQGLQQSLSKYAQHGNSYKVSRGKSWLDIPLDLGNLEEERLRLGRHMDGLHSQVVALQSFDEIGEVIVRSRSRHTGLN